MGSSGSKTPANQTTEVDQVMTNGKNVAIFDMRETQETKLMDSFLVLHQSTMVGMMVGMLVLGAIALTLYACGRCWCSKLHQICGARAREMDNDEVDMAEQGEVPNRESRVTMIK